MQKLLKKMNTISQNLHGYLLHTFMFVLLAVSVVGISILPSMRRLSLVGS